ncbi:hypothetical protein HPB51_024767 [Rhipicephalus microplus]|uniref:HTH psq-type domain-containing protein n=1 Tax=Rhipicephalus microplus TaxID=6941 RepID=A0A9J6D7P0_RHIMP|nr:hypothetical protein HPB51_024767 [Rhipicephalus microplus]
MRAAPPVRHVVSAACERRATDSKDLQRSRTPEQQPSSRNVAPECVFCFLSEAPDGAGDGGDTNSIQALFRLVAVALWCGHVVATVRRLLKVLPSREHIFALLCLFVESQQAMSRKRKALSFKEKLDILRKVDEDPKRKRTELAKELGLATSTLSTIVGQRDTIMKNVLLFSANAKQAKTAQHVKLEESLLIWFKEVTAAGVNIDGKVLREKADEIALALHIDGFQASATNASAKCSEDRTVAPEEPAPTTSAKTSMSGFLLKSAVTKAEIMWCLNAVATHGSFRSTAASASLFPLMFPGCEVAEKLHPGKDKVGYTICHGIAPYFRKNLLSSLAGVPFLVVSFDAAVERGFSVNKECLVENLKEDSLIAQRLVHDAVLAAGGVEKVLITDKMLQMVRNSYSVFREELQKKKAERRVESGVQKNKKRVAALVKELEEKKRRLLSDSLTEASLLQEKIDALKK